MIKPQTPIQFHTFHNWGIAEGFYLGRRNGSHKIIYTLRGQLFTAYLSHDEFKQRVFAANTVAV